MYILMLGQKLGKIFVSVLGELKTPQFPFEISWPLVLLIVETVYELQGTYITQVILNKHTASKVWIF